MKKALILLSSLVLVCSCSTYYTQIATIASNDVKLHDNGDFSYSNSLVTISYDFWSSCGTMCFTVTNASDNDIVLDLTKSNFIDNGYANDYYQGRTFIYSKNVSQSAQVSRQVGVAGAIVGSLSTQYANATSSSSSLTVASNSQVGAAASKGISSGFSVEYREMEYVRIPAHTSKTFGEFNLTDGAYRECGLARNPTSRETAVKEYNANNSPKVFSNLLTFIIDSEELVVNNEFYVSEFRNLNDKDVYETVYVEDCNGNRINNTPVKWNKFASANKFYISYYVSSNESDRINKSSNSKNNKRFNDIY